MVLGRRLSKYLRACGRVKTSSGGRPMRRRTTTGVGAAVRGTSTAAGGAGEEEAREMATFDLVSSGLASVLPVAVFAVAGQMAQDVAGPAGIVSALLAAVAACLHGLTYMEMSSRQWRLRWTAGPAGPYEYVYRTGCELAAFLVGWSALVEHAACSALAARAISLNVNGLLAAQRASDVNKTIIGGAFGGDVVFLDSRVDFVAPLVVMTTLVIAITSLGVDWSTMTSSRWAWLTRIALNGIILALVIFASAVALHRFRFENWTGIDRFLPYQWNGVMSGVATLYGLFWTSDLISSRCTSSSRGNPSNHPSGRWASTATSFITSAVTCVTVMAVTSLTTLLEVSSPVKVNVTRLGAAWQEAYGSSGLPWMKAGLSVAAILFLLPTVYFRLVAGADVIIRLADDGLLMACCGAETRRTVPDPYPTTGPDYSPLGSHVGNTEPTLHLSAYILPGICACVLALLLDVTSTAQMTSLALVTVHLVTLLCMLSTHYRPRNMDHISAVSGRSRRRRRCHRNGQIICTGNNSSNTTESLRYGTTLASNGVVTHLMAAMPVSSGSGDISELFNSGGTDDVGNDLACKCDGNDGHEEAALNESSAVTGDNGSLAPDINLMSNPCAKSEVKMKDERAPMSELNASPLLVTFDSFVGGTLGDGGLDEITRQNDDVTAGSHDNYGRNNCEMPSSSSSSSSSSSDTDIDDAVDEYHERRSGDDDDDMLSTRSPTSLTHRHALLCVVIFVVAVVGLSAIARSHASTMPSALRGSLVVLCVGASAAAAIALHRLPQNDICSRSSAGLCASSSSFFFSSSSFSPGCCGGLRQLLRGKCCCLRRVRLTPLVPLLSVLVTGCFITFFRSSVAILYLISLAIGLSVYIAYGLRHSSEARVIDHVPEDLRILLPASGSADSCNLTSHEPSGRNRWQIEVEA